MLWACFQSDADLIGVHSKNQAITDWVLRVVSAEHAVLLFSESPTGFQSGHFPNDHRRASSSLNAFDTL